ncbi:hypothetical protein OG2516_06886 [Oceanicola granulosus HTCC2516]|uniref:Flagellar FliJ protein n=1 Tax=Oceanicola granulosus (strain ATCC BAA-861 / DSM 15982 / KCTC 12143 / HTCC2516) TaxID=314256 RepID=Q2CGE9_OCEGH|nr:hypothetical protein [Oceanicola granulosus]EAR51769.1 hypothetical protein OG2516_06886 [Oceanicola granulosus HTCC2516]
MSRARRIHALALLERVGRHEMAEEARQLTELRSRAAHHRAEADALDRKLVEETADIRLEAAPYLTRFIQSIRSAAAEHLEQARAADDEARALEDRVLEAFRSLKSVQVALEGERDAEARARLAAETARLDELSAIRHARAMRPR